MKKHFLILILVILSLMLCSCISAREEITERTAETLSYAYDKMLEKNNLAVTYIISGNSAPKKLYIEFGSRSSQEIVYGVESVPSGNNATIKTFACLNSYWYLNDNTRRIIVNRDSLQSSLWMLDLDFVDYNDILECIKPSLVLSEGFSADEFMIERSSDLVSDTYTIKLNSSFFSKKELFINDFEERKTNELFKYDGTLTYYVGKNGIMKEIHLEYICFFDKLATPIKVSVTLTPINTVTTLSKEELALYKIL